MKNECTLYFGLIEETAEEIAMAKEFADAIAE